VVDCSDMFYSDPQNMLMPGLGKDMSDGWETRRRRGPGNDWSIVRLGSIGRISRLVVDSRHFKNNAPGAWAVEARLSPDAGESELRGQDGWHTLLPRTQLLPHTAHAFLDEVECRGPVSHLRIHIYPDGGLSRLRVFGRTVRAEALLLALGDKNALGEGQWVSELEAVCKATEWAQAVASQKPFVDVSQLLIAADRAWQSAGADQWRQALYGHPRIGDTSGGVWSKKEQSGTERADMTVMAQLAQGNRDYETRFGHIFLTCATGKSAATMLAELRQRMSNDADTELSVAAEEQRKITRLRLIKWLIDPQ